jgi:D-lyxose ketol-isomerase
MKRSEINRIMRDGIAFMEERRFLLPPFASWTPDEWRSKGPECREIADRQLGWDITDFGSGDFDACGLFLFTVRNGVLSDPNGKTYAEKIMIVQPGQVTPTHLHYQKMEDIINRGGGDLIIQLWNSIDAERLADTDVTVSMDGVKVTVPAGGTVTLHPGKSVTLTQFLWHKFWGDPDKGNVLVGEVSRVNDDNTDNLFYDGVGRFPEIEEDEEPLRLLTKDYARYYKV